MGVIKAAIGDAILTFLWVFSSSTIGLLSSITTVTLGVQGLALATLFTDTVIVFIFVLAFGLLGDAMGGASFNPTSNASLYAAGLGPDSLLSMAVRFPAQAAGAVGGALAIIEIMPTQYKHLLQGPSLKVDWHTGAIAEGILTFVITFVIFFIFLKGPRNPLLQTWLLAMSTMVLIVAGSGYTGPSMNPANAYGWAFIYNQHNTWEQFYVYWIFPFMGAVSAAWIFRAIFPPPVKQKKKA